MYLGTHHMSFRENGFDIEILNFKMKILGGNSLSTDRAVVTISKFNGVKNGVKSYIPDPPTMAKIFETIKAEAGSPNFLFCRDEQHGIHFGQVRTLDIATILSKLQNFYN